MDCAGIHVPDLPDGITPLEVVVSIKTLDQDGSIAIYERLSEGLSPWEALGMLTTLADSLRDQLTASHRER